MKFSRENVEAGDYVQLLAGDRYLQVTKIKRSTFDAQGDYGRYLDLPYEDIIDLKLESEYFEEPRR